MAGETTLETTYEEFQKNQPLMWNLLRVYAKKYGYTVEKLFEEVRDSKGDTWLQKLESWLQSRKGLTVKGVVKGLYNVSEKEFDWGSLYTADLQVMFPQESVKEIVSRYSLPEEAAAVLQDTRVSVAFFDRQRLMNFVNKLKVGYWVAFHNVRVKQGSKGDIWFVNATRATVGDKDEEFFREASDPAEIAKEADVGDEALLVVKDAIVDPLVKTTSTGKPAVRVYVGENVQIDFIGGEYSAVEALQELGDPWSPEFWKDRTIYVRAVYGGMAGGGDLHKFTVFKKCDVVG